MEQVSRLPEQTLSGALRAMPSKPPVPCFLGVPNLRQEIAVSPEGDIILHADSLRCPGPDSVCRPWSWPELVYYQASGETPVFPPKNRPRVTRWLEENWLPVVNLQWQDGDLTFAETAFATALTNRLESLSSTTGTEPVALVMQIAITNRSDQARQAFWWLSRNYTLPWRLSVDGALVLQSPTDGPQRLGLLPVMGRVNVRGQGDLDMVAMPAGPEAPALTNEWQRLSAKAGLRYRLSLAPHAAHQIEVVIPYVELLNPQELSALKNLAFDTAHAEVVAFWKKRTAQGMTYEVPEPLLNDFFKANLWHVLISTDLDPDTGLAEHGAATHHYRNYLNETAMVARSLEMRGEHREALALLKPFLVSQGRKGLPGNFRTRAGVFYAAFPGEPDPYTAQGYNMHHGWGLWSLAEHFRWTGDAAYLKKHASQLIEGCDWIARERQATRFLNLDGSRPLEYGLAPAGDLEDVGEFLHHYATDAYYYLGMKTVADSLAAIRHREARRLAKAAAEFGADLRASVAEAVATTPVVPLLDGSFIPYVPPRAYALTHRQEGWIREGLYPALHLIATGVYPPAHPYADWMIQELEDNIFPSPESGYGLPNPREDFFSLGGFTLQPNLLDLSLVYLQRDQIANFLRAFFNTAAASVYPDIRCFAEWMPRLGLGEGPLYKTPDECKFIQWMRSMLVWEQDDDLFLGLGVPQIWMKDGQRVRVERAATWFGPLDLEIHSRVATGKIMAQGRLAARQKPAHLWLRLRHPDNRPIRSVSVNGKPVRLDPGRQLIPLPTTSPTWEVSAQY